MRRALAVLASLGLAAGTIALATPAHATTATVEFNSNTDIVVNGTPVSDGFSVRASTINFSNTSSSSVELESATAGYLSSPGGDCNTASNCQVLASGSLVLTVDPQATGLGDRVDVLQPGSVANFVVIYSAGGGTDSGSTNSVGASAPAPVMQQFGLPASGNLEDGYSDWLDWSGVGSGGWGISWAQWMHDGSGGVVCSRTLMYDTSTSKWTVN